MSGTLTSAKRVSEPRQYEQFVFYVNGKATVDDIKQYINCDNMAAVDILNVYEMSMTITMALF